MRHLSTPLTRSERLLPVESADILEDTTAYRTLFLSRDTKDHLYSRISLYWHHYVEHEQKQCFYRRLIASTRIPVRAHRFVNLYSNSSNNNNNKTHIESEWHKMQHKINNKRERNTSRKENTSIENVSEERYEQYEEEEEEEKEKTQYYDATNFMRVPVPHTLATRYFVKLLAPYEKLVCPNLLCSPLLSLNVTFDYNVLCNLEMCEYKYFATTTLCSLITEIASLAAKFALPLHEALLFVSLSLMYIDVMANNYLNEQANESAMNVKESKLIAKDNKAKHNNKFISNVINSDNNAPVNSLKVTHFAELLEEHVKRLARKPTKRTENCSDEFNTNDYSHVTTWDKHHIVIQLYQVALTEWQRRHATMIINEAIIRKCSTIEQHTPTNAVVSKSKSVDVNKESQRACLTVAFAPRDLSDKVWDDDDDDLMNTPVIHTCIKENSQEYENNSQSAYSETAALTTIRNELNEMDYFIPFEPRNTCMKKHMFHLPQLPQDPTQMLLMHVWEKIFQECVRDKCKLYTLRCLFIEEIRLLSIMKKVCLPLSSMTLSSSSSSSSSVSSSPSSSESFSSVLNESKSLEELKFFTLEKWMQHSEYFLHYEQEQLEQLLKDEELEREKQLDALRLKHKSETTNNLTGQRVCYLESFFTLHLPLHSTATRKLWVTDDTCGMSLCGYRDLLHTFQLRTLNTPHRTEEIGMTFLYPTQLTTKFNEYIFELLSTSSLPPQEKELFCTLEELADWVARVGLSLTHLPVNAQAHQTVVFTRLQMQHVLRVLKKVHYRLYTQCQRNGLHEMRLRVSLNGLLLTYIRDDGVETKFTTLLELLFPIFIKLKKMYSVYELHKALIRAWLSKEAQRVQETGSVPNECFHNVINNGGVTLDLEISMHMRNVLSTLASSGYDVLETFLHALCVTRHHKIYTTTLCSNYCNNNNSNDSKRRWQHEYEPSQHDNYVMKSKHTAERAKTYSEEHIMKEDNNNNNSIVDSANNNKTKTRNFRNGEVTNSNASFNVIEFTLDEERVIRHILNSHPHINYIIGCGIARVMLCVDKYLECEELEFMNRFTPHAPYRYASHLDSSKEIRAIVQDRSATVSLLLVMRTCGTFVQVNLSNCYHGRKLQELAAPVTVRSCDRTMTMALSYKSLSLPSNVVDAADRVLFDNVRDMLWYYFNSMTKQLVEQRRANNNNNNNNNNNKINKNSCLQSSTTDKSNCENDNNISEQIKITTHGNDTNINNQTSQPNSTFDEDMLQSESCNNVNTAASSFASSTDRQCKHLSMLRTTLYPTDKAIALYVIRHHPQYYSHLRGCGIAEIFVAPKLQEEYEEEWEREEQQPEIDCHEHEGKSDSLYAARKHENKYNNINENYNDTGKISSSDKDKRKHEPTFLIKRVCGTEKEVDFAECYNKHTSPPALLPHQVICRQFSVRNKEYKKNFTLLKRDATSSVTKLTRK